MESGFLPPYCQNRLKAPTSGFYPCFNGIRVLTVIPIGFLIGLFKDSISKFKSEDYFFNKFKFNYSGSEKYYDCIMDDIYTAVLRLIPQHCK